MISIVAAALTASWLLTPVALFNDPIDGVVLDSATKPLAGAFVVVRWLSHGSDMVGSRTSCAGMAITRSNEAGQYHFAASGMPLGLNIERDVMVYAPSYERTGPYSERRAELKRFSGSGEARASQFRGFSSLRECVHDLDEAEKLRPLYEQLDTEMASLKFDNRKRYYPNGYVEMLNGLEESIKREQNTRQNGSSR